MTGSSTSLRSSTTPRPSPGPGGRPTSETGIKGLISRLAARLGYTIVPHWRVRHHAQALFIARTLALLDVDCVLDVGANRGQYRDFLRDEVGYQGLVISFEPLPPLAQALAARAQADARWIVAPYALGDAEAVATLHVTASDTFSSLLTPTTGPKPLFEGSMDVARDIDVAVHRLDAVIDGLRGKLPFSRPYLKLDTQGYDLNVIRGAGSFMSDVRALQVEASVTPLYEGAPGYVEVIQFLQQAGFELSGMFPNNPEHFPRMIEFDCHMISTRAVPA